MENKHFQNDFTDSVSRTERAAGYFFDIQKRITHIEDFIKDIKTADAFIEDEKTLYAVHMALIVIGQDVRKLFDHCRDILERNQYIPWHDIVGLRNIFSHTYNYINNYKIWKTIKDDIPELYNAIEKIKKNEPEIAECMDEIKESAQKDEKQRRIIEKRLSAISEAFDKAKIEYDEKSCKNLTKDADLQTRVNDKHYIIKR